MKKIICIFLLLTAAGYCRAQYTPTGGNEVIVYTITKNFGDESFLKNAGDIAASFRFDSIGANWNMLTENDYIRFKILHFYIINERKEGEHWKKLYAAARSGLYETFERYMGGKLKKKNYRISAE